MNKDAFIVIHMKYLRVWKKTIIRRILTVFSLFSLSFKNMQLRPNTQPKHATNLHSLQGFSLTEVLIAIAMISIMMTALLGTLPDILKMSRSNQDSMLIVQAAQQYMESVSAYSSELLAGQLEYLPINPSSESFSCADTVTQPDGQENRLRVSLSCYAHLAEADVYDFVLELGQSP